MPVIITLWDDTCQRLERRDWQVFFQGEIQGNTCCCLSVTGLGTSPRHPLALGQSEFMCPWPLLISYPICILIHSFNCVLFHWCFCRNCRKGNITLLVFVLLSTTLLCTLFCHCSVLSSLFCLPSLILFFPFITSRHIAPFLTFNLPPSCFSPITLWTPFFSWIILHFFLTGIVFSCLAQELNFAGKGFQKAAASPVFFCCDSYPRWDCFGLH